MDLDADVDVDVDLNADVDSNEITIIETGTYEDVEIDAEVD